MSRQVLHNAIKIFITGRLRPHFLAVCNPNISFSSACGPRWGLLIFVICALHIVFQLGPSLYHRVWLPGRGGSGGGSESGEGEGGRREETAGEDGARVQAEELLAPALKVEEQYSVFFLN